MASPSTQVGRRRTRLATTCAPRRLTPSLVLFDNHPHRWPLGSQRTSSHGSSVNSLIHEPTGAANGRPAPRDAPVANTAESPVFAPVFPPPQWSRLPPWRRGYNPPVFSALGRRKHASAVFNGGCVDGRPCECVGDNHHGDAARRRAGRLRLGSAADAPPVSCHRPRPCKTTPSWPT